jgi:hypothetical protein
MRILLLRAIPAAALVAGAAIANTAPEQIHIALAGQDANGDATGFSFAWYTADNVSAAPSVQYMVGASADTVTVTGASRQYLADHGGGWHHVARATGIPLETHVNYRVGSDADGWSQNFTAVTPPPLNTTRTVKLSVFGDMGFEDSTLRPMEIDVGGLAKNWSATYSRRTLEVLKNSGAIEAVFHLGDIGACARACRYYSRGLVRLPPSDCEGAWVRSAFHAAWWTLRWYRPGYADDAFGHDPVHFLYESTYNGCAAGTPRVVSSFAACMSRRASSAIDDDTQSAILQRFVRAGTHTTADT